MKSIISIHLRNLFIFRICLSFTVHDLNFPWPCSAVIQRQNHLIECWALNSAFFWSLSSSTVNPLVANLQMVCMPGLALWITAVVLSKVIRGPFSTWAYIQFRIVWFLKARRQKVCTGMFDSANAISARQFANSRGISNGRQAHSAKLNCFGFNCCSSFACVIHC